MNSEPQPSHFEKVVTCSGHMIDAPGRKEPRFPAAAAEVVRDRIARQLEAWQIGSKDLAICGGASGADTLFAEECLRRGASLRLLLAQEVDSFVRDSVAPAGDEWVERFYAMQARASVEVLSSSSDKDDETSIYERTNLWIIETARATAGKLYALLVWDEKPAGDGPGGTADFQKRVCDSGGEVAIINPTKLSLGTD